MNDIIKRLEKMKAVSNYIKEKMKIYMKALQEISQADDQANPIALRNKARIALMREPTTADKHNLVYISDVNKEIAEEMSAADTVIVEEIDKNVSEVTIIQEDKKDIVYGPNDPGDEHVDKVKRTELDEWKRNRLIRFGGDTGTDADFKKEIDIINEQAEAEYRDTVLHPEYPKYGEEE